ncbi:unnamed protein product [Anisakis simplex]|uniref:Uncharacterized protein n=1 Tax=Anisakis simplex TaxID=6269 RepID=A0A0M3KH32_ANISI|nr:unnamed protein product [Anisakis simplex]
MATELEQFGEIVKHMLWPDNNVRTEAEKQYEQIPLIKRSQLLFQLFLDTTVNVEPCDFILGIFITETFPLTLTAEDSKTTMLD